jgi:cytochrome b561
VKETKGYSLLQIVLHWVIVGLIAIQLLFNDAIEDAFEARLEGGAVDGGDGAGAMLHVAVGFAILVLAAIRVGVRLRRGAPPVPQQHNAALRFVARATHVALYVFIFLQPLSGGAAWFLGIERAAGLHSALVWYVFPLVLALHIAGALAEHFVFRTDVLKRMLRPEKV